MPPNSFRGGGERLRSSAGEASWIVAVCSCVSACADLGRGPRAAALYRLLATTMGDLDVAGALRPRHHGLGQVERDTLRPLRSATGEGSAPDGRSLSAVPGP
jgi:hypothetical protein